MTYLGSMLAIFKVKFMVGVTTREPENDWYYYENFKCNVYYFALNHPKTCWIRLDCIELGYT